MKRQDVLDKLSMLQPALASNNMLPALNDFYFTERFVVAYNERIAIYTPFDTGFKGGVPGAPLLGLLKASSANDVTLTTNEEGWFVLKIGQNRTGKFLLRDIEENNFDLEHYAYGKKNTGAKKLPVKSSTLHFALTCCLRSTTDDTSRPEFLGVTFLPAGEDVHLYSTNSKTLTRAVLKGVTLEKRAVIPTLFCEQVLALIDKDSDDILEFEIAPTYANLKTKTTKLFGKLIESEKPIPFVSTYDEHFPKNVRGKLIPTPAKIDELLNSAIVVAATGSGEARMQIVVKEKRLRTITKATVGETQIATFSNTEEADVDHPDVSVFLNPKDVQTGIEFYNKMFVTKSTLIMTNKRGGTFLVSTTVK